MASTLIDLDALLLAVVACQVAVRPIASDKGKVKPQGSKPSSSREESDSEVSNEDWVEAGSDAKESSDKMSSGSLNDDMKDTEQRLQGIKQTLQKLAEQVRQLQDGQKTNKGMTDAEKQALIKMMPVKDSCHDHRIVCYGNQFGHGVKCITCQTKVFKHRGASNISIKIAH